MCCTKGTYLDADGDEMCNGYTGIILPSRSFLIDIDDRFGRKVFHTDLKFYSILSMDEVIEFAN